MTQLTRTTPRPPAPAAARSRTPLDAPSGPVRIFEPSMAASLPEPARRWLLHAIRPGTALLTSVRLTMHGRIRLGHWCPFQADQLLNPSKGFEWAATARPLGLPVSGADRYHDGRGEMRWRLLGAVPVLSAVGPDITRSAAGRLAAEFVMAPATALSPQVTWEPIDHARARALVAIDGRTHPATLTVAADGALESVALPRWGRPGKGPFAEHPFGVRVHGEATFDGFTILSEASAGWWHGTEHWKDGEFIRFTVDRARYR
ncbi:DUF6544 family protein [Spirillospora sp. NPDC050679]